jgi:hypothetical protein
MIVLFRADTTIVVPKNDARVAINQRRFDSYCIAHSVDAKEPGTWQQRGAIVIKASIEAANAATDIAAKLNYLRQHAFSGVKNGLVRAITGQSKKEVVGHLRLIVGAPVMVLNNDQTTSGIVNGTVATLVDVIVQRDDAVTFEQTLAPGGGVHCVDAANVSGLILRYTDQKWARQGIFPCLPTGCFPLKLPGWRSVKVHIGGSYAEVRVKQFQCTPAFALTGNKVQGATLSNLLVASWRAPKRGLGCDGWIYVVLSRVRSIQTLFALEQLPNDSRQYVPRTDIAIEMARLRAAIFDPTFNFLSR